MTAKEKEWHAARSELFLAIEESHASGNIPEINYPGELLEILLHICADTPRKVFRRVQKAFEERSELVW